MDKIIAKEKKTTYILWTVMAVYAVALLYLYYNQTQYFVTGKFESDLPYHIKFAVEDKYFYSLSTYLYYFLSFLPGFYFWVSVCLTAATLLSIVLSKVLFKEVFRRLDCCIGDNEALGLSIIANFVLGFYVSVAGKSHYIAYQSGNLWHNSTYILMRVFAIMTVLCWLKYSDEYKEGIKVKSWLSLSGLLMLTTAIKASFFTVFGLLMAISLLIDLINKTKFFKVFISALTVIPSFAVMAFQTLVLFGEESGNGYLIKPFYTLSLRGEHPKVTLILSLLFPILVGLMHIRDFIHKKIYLQSIVFWLVGFLEVFLLAETGSRSKDGNFLWGYSISIFFFFLVSIAVYITDIHKALIQGTREKKTSVFSICGLVICGGVLAWHFISGIWYFCLLLTSVTYFV